MTGRTPRLTIVPRTESSTLLAVHGLRASYGRGHEILAGIDISLAAGQVLALVGPNGAGKTTLLSALAGIMPASAGTVRIDGRLVDVDRNPEERRLLGVVLGGMTLVEELRPPEFFEFVASLQGVPRGAAAERAFRMVDRLSLRPHLGKRIRDLSTGTRKKVELIAALVHEPRILLLDEPYEALDPPSAGVFTSVVGEYVRERHAVAVVSSHIIPWVQPLATDSRFLWAGRLYARAEVETLMEEAPDAGELRAWAEILAA